MMLQTTISFLLLLVVFKISGGNKITIGKAAAVKCKEWKKSCDPGFLCVIQHLQWPMNMSFPICIPESEISGMLIQVKLRICQKPRQPGNCGARFVRWYFDTQTQQCSMFFYQGCRGNENNFKSKSQCEAECMPNQQTNVIQKPLIYNSPVVLTEPVRSPDYSNYIDKAYSMVRSKGVDYERRRKRRLEKRRQKRIRRLMRKRRKSLRSKKRRREGKVKTKGGKKKRKNRKKKNKNKKKGRRGKKKKNKKSKGEKSTITFIPGDEISDKNSDLMKKLVSQESSTVRQEGKRKDSKL